MNDRLAEKNSIGNFVPPTISQKWNSYQCLRVDDGAYRKHRQGWKPFPVDNIKLLMWGAQPFNCLILSLLRSQTLISTHFLGTPSTLYVDLLTDVNLEVVDNVPSLSHCRLSSQLDKAAGALLFLRHLVMWRTVSSPIWSESLQVSLTCQKTSSTTRLWCRYVYQPVRTSRTTKSESLPRG